MSKGGVIDPMPCPFCGQKPKVSLSSINACGREVWRVWRTNEKCVNVESLDFTACRAVNRWNKRMK